MIYLYFEFIICIFHFLVINFHLIYFIIKLIAFINLYYLLKECQIIFKVNLINYNYYY